MPLPRMTALKSAIRNPIPTDQADQIPSYQTRERSPMGVPAAFPCACRCANAGEALSTLTLILAVLATSARELRDRERSERLARKLEHEAHDRFMGAERALELQPENLLQRGLARVASQWHAPSGRLLADGAGIGRADIRRACSGLSARNLRSAYISETLWLRWRNANPALQPQVAAAVHRVLMESIESTRASRNSATTASIPPMRADFRNRATQFSQRACPQQVDSNGQLRQATNRGAQVAKSGPIARAPR